MNVLNEDEISLQYFHKIELAECIEISKRLETYGIKVNPELANNDFNKTRIYQILIP